MEAALKAFLEEFEMIEEILLAERPPYGSFDEPMPLRKVIEAIWWKHSCIMAFQKKVVEHDIYRTEHLHSREEEEGERRERARDRGAGGGKQRERVKEGEKD